MKAGRQRLKMGPSLPPLTHPCGTVSSHANTSLAAAVAAALASPLPPPSPLMEKATTPTSVKE
uniref:Uncharacterized protein n=1 Tax=Oryza glumipatula TaxID=40148 RepID=A0A0E0AGG0_9ORYZ